MLPLGLLSSGEKAEVAKIKTVSFSGNIRKENNGLERIEELGLRPGKRVKMLHNNAGSAIIVGIDNSRIAIDRQLAMKILVKKEM